MLNNGSYVDILSQTKYIETGLNNKAIAEINPFRFRGYYFDTETGLYYLQTRYYDPETGRFINADALEYLDKENINGLNLYAYCGNNPVMNVDHSGEAWWNPFSWDWKKIGEALLVVASIAACVGIAVLTAGAGGVVGAILTAGFIGAAGSLTGQFIGDITTSIISGTWQLSSFNTYFGAAIGGFAGGVALAITGSTNIAFGVADGVTTMSTSLLNGEAIKTAIWKGIGSFVVGLIRGGTKIGGVTKGRGSFMSVYKAGLRKMVKYNFAMSAKVALKGFVATVAYKITSSIGKGLLKGLDFSKLFTKLA